MVLSPLLVSAGPFLMGKHVVSAEWKTQIFSDPETQLQEFSQGDKHNRSSTQNLMYREA